MWKPGQSGNPVGKKPGTGKIDKLRAALTKELPEILDALVTQAKAGDTQGNRAMRGVDSRRMIRVTGRD